ncbi:hypothetical protein O3P69_006956 [Scylla paramamosain]|uniref:Uncharacterized protein n=1 Tax=Scylla paramamosain TaxID=85552 RepID=A0AAW0V3B5_SCYPA
MVMVEARKGRAEQQAEHQRGSLRGVWRHRGARITCGARDAHLRVLSLRETHTQGKEPNNKATLPNSRQQATKGSNHWNQPSGSNQVGQPSRSNQVAATKWKQPSGSNQAFPQLVQVLNWVFAGLDAETNVVSKVYKSWQAGDPHLPGHWCSGSVLTLLCRVTDHKDTTAQSEGVRVLDSGDPNTQASLPQSYPSVWPTGE